MSHESIVLSDLEPFYKKEWITDVLHVVKSGKEATVYCCEAHPSTGMELLAAKVYRSRNDRSFKNDSVYREGRWVPQKSLRRAIERKNRVGRATEFVSWVEHEFQTLRLLRDAGADVPVPYAQSASAILMEYVGDCQTPAPPLNKVSLAPDEVRSLFDVLLRNVELWLECRRIHADLSAFNILYWEGGVKIIDFPQAVDPRFNPNAFALLERDLANLCKYWSRYGVQADPRALAHGLWRRSARA